MSYTVSFFALRPDGTERVLRSSIIPAEIFAVYQSAPEVSFYAAQRAGGAMPDGFRVTDDIGRVRVSFTAPKVAR